MRFSVLAEFFAVLDDYFFGFAVSNTPQCPPLICEANVGDVFALQKVVYSFFEFALTKSKILSYVLLACPYFEFARTFI